MNNAELKTKLDGLTPRAKRWLHGAAQQLNDGDADGYIDHKESRAECVAAGVIEQRGRGVIEFSSEANDLLYSQQYLAAFGSSHNPPSLPGEWGVRAAPR